MRLFLAAAAAAFLATLSAPASADVITTYVLSNGGTSNGGLVTGTFQIDQTTWNNATNAGFVGGSVTVTNDGAYDGTYNFAENNSQFTVFKLMTASLFDTMDVDTGGPPPLENGTVGLSGSITTIDTTTQSIDFDVFIEGTLTASTPVATPEPESWAVFLVAFIALGFLMMRRRNFLAI